MNAYYVATYLMASQITHHHIKAIYLRQRMLHEKDSNHATMVKERNYSMLTLECQLPQAPPLPLLRLLPQVGDAP